MPTTNIVKYLGITVNDSLTPCTHIAKITAAAHQRVNLIVRSFTSRDISICYCVHILHMLDPYLNITLLFGPLRLNVMLLLLRKCKGGLQSASLDSEISVMPNAEVNSTYITTLELRRLDNDLVMCYKIMFNIIRLEFSNFFTFNTYSSSRGHPYKLYVNHSRINVSKHFFACRVVNVWNSLPLNSDDFRSLHCFRSSLNNIDFSRFLIIE